MRNVPASTVLPGHSDYAVLRILADEIGARLGRRPADAFVGVMIDAIEFVLDPVRTGRTSISELDNVEKTFVGLKIEHYLRDLLDAPKGIRDLEIAGFDVDVKNTLSPSWSWMIPPESFRAEEPVLLLAADEAERRSWLGLMLTREAYLGAPNRDGKRGVRASAYENILWLARGIDWPKSRWVGLDMKRFRELRRIRVGAARAAQFFLENPERITHRAVLVSLLFDQLDPLKRLRANGGAPDLLTPKGIALLSGRYNSILALQLGFTLSSEDFVALSPKTDEELSLLRSYGMDI